MIIKVTEIKLTMITTSIENKYKYKEHKNERNKKLNTVCFGPDRVIFHSFINLYTIRYVKWSCSNGALENN